MATQTESTRKALPFAADAEQTLRFAAMVARSNTVYRVDLWQALTSPPTDNLRAVRLCPAPGLESTVTRAKELAAAQSRPTVTRGHLLEALFEVEAPALGLNLAVLRFHRWRAAQNGTAPRLRQYTAEPVPADARAQARPPDHERLAALPHA